MAGPSYAGLFNSWEIAVAKKIIGEFRRKWRCLKYDDFDDLLQECLFHWYRTRGKYNPSSKASQRTFMARVVSNKLRDHVKEMSRQRRKVLLESESLYDLLPGRQSHDAEDGLTLSDIIPVESISAIDDQVQAELKEVVSNFYQHLTSQQRRICNLLIESFSIAGVSRELRINRKTVYKEILRIRVIAEKASLRGFLP
ncbi:RNA polymerase sigma-70 region 2 domain protein [Candidatus Omnitrophus magneticus]|uniref:RNA polymerase sigma-70 region 2 domain protein n=1 Tax=Candidatus Omnitrophus magneticus TaxID=1609969 RepID=A0A0F0CTY1_9BACT|nr:RNA polymerase sigma-70 region 2 domain protein [Candidatus Omnitrophus magneticus]